MLSTKNSGFDFAKKKMQYGPKVHINKTNEAIPSTVDSKHENGEMPFLDCRIKRNTGGTLDTTA